MPIEDYPNLVPNTARSPEELREQTRKGGIASGEARRRKRTIAEVARAILDSPEMDPETLALLQSIGLEGTNRDTMTLAQIVRAKKGDPDSFRLVRDTIGEKPREELEIGGLVDRPIQTIDMSKLTDEQLRQLAAARAEL